jgi:hypothetical protein
MAHERCSHRLISHRVADGSSLFDHTRRVFVHQSQPGRTCTGAHPAVDSEGRNRRPAAIASSFRLSGWA